SATSWPTRCTRSSIRASVISHTSHPEKAHDSHPERSEGSAVAPLRASILRRLLAHRSGRRALIAIAILVLAALVGPTLVAHSSTEQLDPVRMKSQPPSWAFPFGTDLYSRDVLSRVLSGARISLSVATLAVLLSMTLGTAYGLISGFIGGRVDAAMMRILD